MSLQEESLRLHVQSIMVETKRWCWRAIAQGVGNRVWRSEPIYEKWPSTVIRYHFAILKPGEPAPGSGIIFGPFSKAP